MPIVASALLMFTPERWGQLDKFRKFWSETYKFTERDQRALAGVGAHFEKSVRLVALARRLRPNLRLDLEQLNRLGHTPAENSKELATVIEAAILELYSSLDCTIKVLRAVYSPGTRGFKESTRKTFQNPADLVGTFPEELKTEILDATWYWKLLRLRDELTHLDTGSVHFADDDEAVRYDHYGMKEGQGRLSIPDIFVWLDEMLNHVNRFLGIVFLHLNRSLGPKPVFQMCGMVEGRLLHRFVVPSGQLTFDSGECGAWVWFELPQNPDCPFKDHCGAYGRKAPPQGWET